MNIGINIDAEDDAFYNRTVSVCANNVVGHAPMHAWPSNAMVLPSSVIASSPDSSKPGSESVIREPDCI